MSESRPYHHGDLRSALLSAALELLEEGGLASLSLRGAAARAGVSHAAPKHHFGNRKGLLTAIATIGYSRFAATMAEECARSAQNPLGQVRAITRGYVKFALQNRAIFRLMFSLDHYDRDNQELAAAVCRAFTLLEDTSRSVARALGVAEGDAWREIANLIWTTVHGYAHLLIDGRLVNRTTGEPEPIPDIGRLLFDGFNGSGRKP